MGGTNQGLLEYDGWGEGPGVGWGVLTRDFLSMMGGERARV